MISDSVRQIRERSVASVDSDGGAMLKHLAEAIDLRLHALQFSLVRGAVQHRDGRWRIAASDMRQWPPAVHPVAHRRSAGHPWSSASSSRLAPLSFRPPSRCSMLLSVCCSC